MPNTRKVCKRNLVLLKIIYIKAGNFWLSFIIYTSTNWRGTISLIDCFFLNSWLHLVIDEVSRKYIITKCCR